MRVDVGAPELDVAYTSAEILFDTPEGDEPIYQGANFTNAVPFGRGDDLVGIRLTNQGTGNKYVDKTIETRLYSNCRFEHGYDDMLVPSNGTFYVGIHTRDTRRNEYVVDCKIGTSFREVNKLTNDEKKLLPFCP